MKYVRVYEGDFVEDEYLTTYQEHCERVAILQDNGFDFEGYIVKQADTIEELCDEFVIWTENKKAKELANYDVAKVFMRNYNVIIYGAIWTDKGLIYVAKMNDKGELELL